MALTSINLGPPLRTEIPLPLSVWEPHRAEDTVLLAHGEISELIAPQHCASLGPGQLEVLRGRGPDTSSGQRLCGAAPPRQGRALYSLPAGASEHSSAQGHMLNFSLVPAPGWRFWRI